MGRKRLEKDKWMPAKVYRGKCAFEFRPIKAKAIRLCSLDAKEAVVIRRYKQEYDKFHSKSGTIGELFELYFDSVKFKKLGKLTKKDYKKYWKHLKIVFEKVEVTKLRSSHMVIYMEKKGESSEVQANRHLSLMKSVYKWVIPRDTYINLNTNPCTNVERFKEAKRKRLINDEEYNLMYIHAPTTIKVIMEISYLCAARQGDVLKLTKDQLLDEGIFIAQGKTDKEQIKEWNSDLRKVIALAKTIPNKNNTKYLINSIHDTRYTSEGFQSNWHKLKIKVREISGLPMDFTFHDIKAKSITEYHGDRKRFAGHSSEKQTETYIRKPDSVESLDRSKIVPTKKTGKMLSN